MEFDNPITLLEGFLGTWKGIITENEIESESGIEWRRYGFDMHILEISKTLDKTDKILESLYLFFDKTKEQLKCIIFNTDGYVESSNVELLTEDSKMMLRIVFDHGYNLPPNMKIVREITKGEKDNSLILVLRMGEKQQIYSEANYRKNR
ncbi:MAG: hypothetical protein ACTSVO_01010 [Candidatus Heimdallarchaeaceae archaeon]